MVLEKPNIAPSFNPISNCIKIILGLLLLSFLGIVLDPESLALGEGKNEAVRRCGRMMKHAKLTRQTVLRSKHGGPKYSVKIK